MNAWALLYDELYGDEKMTEDNRITPQESDEYDPITGVGDKIEIDVSDFIVSGDVGFSTASAASIADCASAYFVDTSDYEVTIDTSNFDTVTFGGEDLNPTPGIQSKSTRKYNEDKSIDALKEYVASTYGGHYTSENNNVQTLDLIESVGDAEAFCRSNAIKYLSRYDKKGQAKRDILKALHYSLLLYHFSGQLNETPTRGYETF